MQMYVDNEASMKSSLTRADGRSPSFRGALQVRRYLGEDANHGKPQVCMLYPVVTAIEKRLPRGLDWPGHTRTTPIPQRNAVLVSAPST